MEEKLAGLTDIALDPHMLLTAGAIFFLIRMIRKTQLAKWSLYWRALPILPDILGVVATVAGAVPALSDQPILVRCAAGLWCGYLSQRTHKVLGQTLLGDDPDIAKAQKAKKEASK